MTATNVLDWTVALFVCWASLTAILEPRRDASQCDGPTVVSSAQRAPLAAPTEAEFEETIRDMKLHD